MKLRPYQQEAEAALYQYFMTHHDGNPVMALPTGTGKAVIIGSLCRGILQTWPGQRVMMLTHVKELIKQNADKLLRIWPQAPLGIYSAGLKSKQLGHAITFAGIQSIAKKADEIGHIDLIFVDECHLVSPNENTAYQTFIGNLRKINPNLRVIGLSATPYRLGLGMITDGGIFTDVCYDITTKDAFVKLIDDGYLSPLIPFPTQTQLDISGVGKRQGEFIQSELQTAVNKHDVTVAALNEMMRKIGDRNHVLIFAAGIEHAEDICSILIQMGESATIVHSKMSDEQRDLNLASFLNGQNRFMVNNDILTTGFDFPALDCIILLRPTSSPGLHVQILGRGTRPVYADGFDLDTTEGRLQAIANGPKQNCLVLDFAGNIMRLGPVNDPRIPKKKGEGDGSVPIKVCKECDCLNHISARFCAACGHEFEIAVKISAIASTADLIVRDQPKVEVFPVERVTYAPHIKPGHYPSLKVSYFCGKRRFTEWVCLEHKGPIQRKAEAWWRHRSSIEPPTTIHNAMALAGTLKEPQAIRVWVNKKYPEVMSYVF